MTGKLHIMTLGLCSILGFSFATAQPTSAFQYAVETDSTHYAIGAEIHLWQYWQYPENHEVAEQPVLPDTFGDLYRVDMGETQFSKQNGLVKAKRLSRYTVLDTGAITLPIHRWYFTKDQYIESDQIKLNIQLKPIAKKAPPKDIMPIKRIPRAWYEIVGGMALGMLILAAISAMLWFVFWYLPQQRRKKKALDDAKPRPAPHEEALEELRLLAESGRLQSGDVKGYHGRISYITKQFLEQRYHIHAHDLTADELMEKLKLHQIPPEALALLNEVLQLGNLAKFAKAVLSNEVNKQCLEKAKAFVHACAPSEPKDEPQKVVAH